MAKQHNITQDEASLLKHWRQLKRHKKGHLKISLKSDGTQFYLEPTPTEIGKVEEVEEGRSGSEK